MDDAHLLIEHAEFAVGDHFLVCIPLSPIGIHAANVTAIFWRRLWIQVFVRLGKVEGESIDGDVVLAREVLRDTCQITLDEVETGYPANWLSPVVHPVLHEGQTLEQVFVLEGQLLARGIRGFKPLGGHIAVDHRVRYSF